MAYGVGLLMIYCASLTWASPAPSRGLKFMLNSQYITRVVSSLTMSAMALLSSAMAEDLQEPIAVRNKIKDLIEDDPIEVLSKIGQGGWCGWISKQPGAIYRNQSNQWIQDFVIYGNPQLQYSYVNGTDANGEDFHYGELELRRFTLNAKAHLLNYFIFQTGTDIEGDGESSDQEDDRSFNYTLHNLDFIFDAQSAFQCSNYELLQLKLGYFKVPSNAGWTESSNSMRAIERTSISNYASPDNSMGAMLSGSAGRFDFTLGGFFSDDITDGASLGRGAFFLGHLGYAFTDTQRWDEAKVDLRLLVNGDPDTGETYNQDWSASISTKIRKKHWRMTAELIVGENGDQNGSAQSDGYWGVALTPSVWILEDQLEAVFSYQYAHASRSEGFRISSHSARRAADAVDADINGGYGDDYQSLYAGLNYYFCGDHTKVMLGFQWDDLESDNHQVYQGLTTWLALRVYF